MRLHYHLPLATHIQRRSYIHCTYLSICICTSEVLFPLPMLYVVDSLPTQTPADDPHTGSRSPKLGSAQPKLRGYMQTRLADHTGISKLECEHRCNYSIIVQHIHHDQKPPVLSTRNFRVPPPNHLRRTMISYPPAH